GGGEDQVAGGGREVVAGALPAQQHVPVRLQHGEERQSLGGERRRGAVPDAPELGADHGRRQRQPAREALDRPRHGGGGALRPLELLRAERRQERERQHQQRGQQRQDGRQRRRGGDAAAQAAPVDVRRLAHQRGLVGVARRGRGRG